MSIDTPYTPLCTTLLAAILVPRLKDNGKQKSVWHFDTVLVRGLASTGHSSLAFSVKMYLFLCFVNTVIASDVYLLDKELLMNVFYFCFVVFSGGGWVGVCWIKTRQMHSVSNTSGTGYQHCLRSCCAKYSLAQDQIRHPRLYMWVS